MEKKKELKRIGNDAQTESGKLNLFEAWVNEWIGKKMPCLKKVLMEGFFSFIVVTDSTANATAQSPEKPTNAIPTTTTAVISTTQHV